MFVAIRNVSHISTNFCIHFVYKRHTKYIQNVCIQNVSFISTNFVYKMHTKCLYATFHQTFLYILYTKFSWCSSFDFVYKMYTKVCRNMVYILFTFCIHFVYISSIYLLQFFYTKCIHSFRVRWVVFINKIIKLNTY